MSSISGKFRVLSRCPAARPSWSALSRGRGVSKHDLITSLIRRVLQSPEFWFLQSRVQGVVTFTFYYAKNKSRNRSPEAGSNNLLVRDTWNVAKGEHTVDRRLRHPNRFNEQTNQNSEN